MRYSPRAEEACVHWIRAFIRFHRERHPREMGGPENVELLNHIATTEQLSVSSQNQALCAIVFHERPLLQLDAVSRLHRAALASGPLDRAPVSHPLVPR